MGSTESIKNSLLIKIIDEERCTKTMNNITSSLEMHFTPKMNRYLPARNITLFFNVLKILQLYLTENIEMDNVSEL